MGSRSRRSTWMVVVVILALAGLTGGAALFQPWRLLVDERVDDELPAVVEQASTPFETVAPTVGPPSSSPSASTPSSSSSATRPATAPAGPVTVRRGTLISHEHETSGRVRVVAAADGRRFLRLEDLDTSSGPDLRVWLSDAPVIAGRTGWFVFSRHPSAELGALKANHGNQNYLIPDDVDLDDYRSVVIWCKRFRVSFGAAELS